MILDKYHKAHIKVQIEEAENRIRAQHNELESKRILGKKNYLPYQSKAFITLIKMVRKKIK